MNRRHFAFLFASAASCFALPALGQGNSGKHGHGKDHDHGHDDWEDDDHGHGEGNRHSRRGERYFSDRDRDYVIRYYNGPRNLPPGLRKKYYRYGTLPPGWQKRFRPMPPVVIQQLPPVPYGYQRGYYDGYAVVVDPRTRVIYDAIDIIGALSNR